MVLKPPEIQARLERILPTVRKPGRYTGGELNQIVKDWSQVQTKVALVFPDIYDLGMSNLGLAILYDILNQRSDALAERVYAPWIDMEAAMREADIPLFSLESKHALSDFDILGISLPYETLYTNTLNVLDLGGIPIFNEQRDESQPLVIAGGHATFNPEPMHLFIDAFVIGEGEEVINEIVDAYQVWRSKGTPRVELLSQTLRRLLQVAHVPRHHRGGRALGHGERSRHVVALRVRDEGERNPASREKAPSEREQGKARAEGRPTVRERECESGAVDVLHEALEAVGHAALEPGPEEPIPVAAAVGEMGRQHAERFHKGEGETRDHDLG